jgi:hypothetical protein
MRDVDLSIFDEVEPLAGWAKVRAHVGGPWSWRRAWGIVLAGLSRTPGLRAHVLYTTSIKDHPMFALMERADAAALKPKEKR